MTRGCPRTCRQRWRNTQFKSPSDVVIDRSNNVFIADRDNERIRKIDGFGIISTVVGSGNLNPLGDGGSATAAGLYNPSGLAIDNLSNLVIADTNHVSGVLTP
jgi:hypothetical protein